MTFTPIDWFILVSVPAIAWIIGQRSRRVGTWRGYFLANSTLSNTNAGAAYVGANLTFTAIFLLLSEEAYKRGAIVFCVPLFWVVGTIATHVLYPRLRKFFKTGTTLHQALGEVFGSMGLQQWAAIWTIVAFIGTIGLEFYGGIRLLEWANLPFLRAESLALLLAFLVGAFTVMGGFRGIAVADRFLDAVMFLALGVLLFFLFQVGAQSNTHDWSAALRGPNQIGDNVLFLVGMAILFIPFQLCLLDTWQRFGSAEGNKEMPPKWLLIGGFALAFAYCVPILIGIFVRAELLLAHGTDHPLKVFLDTAHLPAGLIGIVFAGFLAAIFSTADELLNCCALSWLFDWAKIPRSDPGRTEANEKQIVLSGQCYTSIFAVIAGLVAACAAHGRGISDLAIAIFSGQVLFAIPLIFLMFRPRSAPSRVLKNPRF